jgi:hypothetical protein
MEGKTEAVVIVNVFTPKAGRLDEFIDIQTAELPRFSGNSGFPG